MATGLDLACPKQFNPNGEPTKLSEQWKRWKKGFDLYLAAVAITDEARQRALLLHCGGMDLQELFRSLPTSDAAATYADTIALLDGHFIPQSNKRYERHIFRSCVQTGIETIAQYVTRLRTLTHTCEFTDVDDAIIDQVIEKCKYNKFRKNLLKEKDLTVKKILEIAQIMESTERQIETYKQSSHSSAVRESDDEEVNEIRKKQPSRRKHDKLSKKLEVLDFDDEDEDVQVIRERKRNFRKSTISHTQKSDQSFCYRCGNPSHLANKCTVAINNKCSKCNKMGHFASVCGLIGKKPPKENSQSIRYIAASSSDDDFLWKLEDNAVRTKDTFNIKINGNLTNVLIDSGSTVNVISKSALKQAAPGAKLKPCTKNIFAFNSTSPLLTCGTTDLPVIAFGRFLNASFVVIPNDSITILGRKDATNLNLLRVGPPPENIHTIVTDDSATQLNKLLDENACLFHGLGKLKGVEVDIHTDKNITPLAQKARRLPILMQQQVDQEIDRLMEYGVIEPVVQPPTWVSPLVIVPKKDSSAVRVCVDMRAANTAIIREPYQIPTLEEMAHEFRGCTIFTKLDLNKGYHQIALAPGSRDLTAFATRKGIFRYTRLLFGMSAAAEIYQRLIEEALVGLERTRNISDDIIIGGKDSDELVERTKAVFTRLREKGLTINKAKCQFMQPEITYMGHILSEKGIAPDINRTDSIIGLKSPTNVKELRSFLGMITYCSKFIPDFATITAPLRNLLKLTTTWHWGDDCEHSFKLLKELLLSSQTLCYFDPKAVTEVVVDASPFGLGAVISQVQPDGSTRPVSYASRALSDVEQRYSQIERECLAILFAIQRFRIYLYGISFTVKTDHKPLLAMFSRKCQPPPRIQRWVARLMPYKFDVQYQPGHLNSADYLSRSNPVRLPSASNKMGEHFIKMIAMNSLPNSLTLAEIQEASSNDPIQQRLRHCIQTGQFRKKGLLEEYYSIRNFLSCSNGLILYKHKILIPTKLRLQVFQLAHEGHQGIVRTKQRLRKKVYWPGMSSFVDDNILTCHPCQLVGKSPPKTPIQVTKIPESSWLMVGCDLCGPFPSGENLLVCVDYYSRYPEVEILHSISSETIASKLRKYFCRYGPPDTIVTDNGPQFQKKTAFTALLKEFAVDHRKVTPYHPAANGEVERFNRNLKKCIQTAIADGENWRVVLQNFLLSYRTTPHAITGVPPADLFFGRSIRDKLPSAPSSLTQNDVGQSAKLNDTKRKLLSQKYTDNKNKAVHHNIKPGDTVLVQNPSKRRNKFTTRWEAKPCKVTEVKGNAIFMQRGKKHFLRNSQHVKKYHMKSPTISNNMDTDLSSNDESTILIDSDPDNDITIPYEMNSNDSNDTNSTDDDSDQNITSEIENNEEQSANRYKPKRTCVLPKKYDDFILGDQE